MNVYVFQMVTLNMNWYPFKEIVGDLIITVQKLNL